jgi:hypothetical protein
VIGKQRYKVVARLDRSVRGSKSRPRPRNTRRSRARRRRSGGQVQCTDRSTRERKNRVVVDGMDQRCSIDAPRTTSCLQPNPSPDPPGLSRSSLSFSYRHHHAGVTGASPPVASCCTAGLLLRRAAGIASAREFWLCSRWGVSTAASPAANSVWRRRDGTG